MIKCVIKNCPAYNNDCLKYEKACEEINDCVIKRCLDRLWQRPQYIKNKLSTCYGYSDKEKKIRFEEYIWLFDEYKVLLDIEVKKWE